MTAHDLEPQIEAMLNEALLLRNKPPYPVRTQPQIKASLQHFLNQQSDLANPEIKNLKPLGGGASKEQFVFDLIQNNQPTQRCVLRMDPLESAVVTNREREYAILDLMQGIVPSPKPLWVDYTGEQLGCPSLITDFIGGVTKPSLSTSNVSGFGTVFDLKTREMLTKPFLKHLTAMHTINWKDTPYDCFSAPTADPKQAARWQLNWWSKVWHNDTTEGLPIMGLAERWMRDNLPSCSDSDLVFVHSDYRTGNFLYNEDTLDITAILDWELIHVGDFHEDLAWAAIKSWSTIENGELLASGLTPVNSLCEQYSLATGRAINKNNFYFYQVLGLYKCVAICLATSVNAASNAHNHQDALLSWLAASGYSFLNDLCLLLEEGIAE